MDDSVPNAHSLLSDLYVMKRDYDRAIAEGERAVALDPNGAMAHEVYAACFVSTPAGRSQPFHVYQKAVRLNPYGSASLFSLMGYAYRITGQYEEAVSNYKKALLRGPKFWDLGAHVGLTATYIMLGREKEARSEAAEVLRINPRVLIEDYFAKSTSPQG